MLVGYWQSQGADEGALDSWLSIKAYVKGFLI